MGKRFECKMVKPYNNSGFNLIETLLVVFIISTLSLLFISPFVQRASIQTSEIVFKQVLAMRDLKRKQVDTDLWFNENGNINRAQTKKISNMSCVFNLGFGRFSCE